MRARSAVDRATERHAHTHDSEMGIYKTYVRPKYPKHLVDRPIDTPKKRGGDGPGKKTSRPHHRPVTMITYSYSCNDPIGRARAMSSRIYDAPYIPHLSNTYDLPCRVPGSYPDLWTSESVVGQVDVPLLLVPKNNVLSAPKPPSKNLPFSAEQKKKKKNAVGGGRGTAIPELTSAPKKRRTHGLIFRKNAKQNQSDETWPNRKAVPSFN
ncbi:hypothetical protein F5I97DRAFT_1119460 [Phlebopus sp. FC_14]|nr:hypothetical protein F5I97DRAFT_1119460 [Phlebopus sp. FC_14]